MKESYREGEASHPDPESCAGGGNTPGEALTGAHTGQLLSSEITSSACRPSGLQGKATSGPPLAREAVQDAAESKNLSMCENSMRENRETPAVPRSDALGRSEKGNRTSDMHAAGESDGPVVPAKRANKGGTPPLAESVEGRGSAKGNPSRDGHPPGTAPEQGVVRTGKDTAKSSVGIGSSLFQRRTLRVMTQGRSRMSKTHVRICAGGGP
jgi:hypothetical protein